MKDKFTMPLTWHNCQACPPEELGNSYLLATNGNDVYSMSWHRAHGYWIATEDNIICIPITELENWWWADIEQTVRGCSEFKGE